jgi:F-type H+-transporting ATPase subunit a
VSSPIEQFVIKPVLPLGQVMGIDVSVTNSALMMLIAAVVTAVTFYVLVRPGRMIPSMGQSFAEMSYSFIRGIVTDTAGEKALKFVPFVFTLFFFVLMGNLLGMMPYGFTFTSHLVVTFALAAIVFIVMTVVGLVRHGFHFFHLFLPTGTPLLLAPVMIPIEIFSYFVRPVSMSLRLFANMMAGGMLLKVFIGFAVTMGMMGFIPFIMAVLLIGFKIMIGVIQAYIFALLTCIYLKDAIHLH